MAHILEEAAGLVDAGARELVLVGQDTAHYGADRYGRRMLGTLLRKAAREFPETWIRVMYCHPSHLEDDVLEAMAEFPNVCPYLDIPIQHAHDEILRAMGRPDTRGKLRRSCRLANEATRSSCNNREHIPFVIILSEHQYSRLRELLAYPACCL